MGLNTRGHKFLIVLLTLKLSVYVSSYCPPDKIHSIGHCSFRVRCIGTIRNITLPEICQGSTNYPVKIDLTLSHAIERFDDHLIDLDTDVLDKIVTLRVSGAWKSTSLALIDNMPNLEKVYLVGNKIEHITSQPFFRLHNLVHLDLSHNNLTDIDDLFKFDDDSELKRLLLAHNSIAKLPVDVFEKLTSLIELDLSHNHLSDLTDEPFSNLTSLQILRLNNNKIKDLNGAINFLKNLKHLYVSGNNLQNIDEQSLQIIYHLETFDISGNDLDTLKPSFFWRHWNHIEDEPVCKIIISENHIKYIPNATEEITKRFNRDLTGNDQRVVTELDLSKNDISKIEYNAFKTIVQLTSLDLSCNKISHFMINPKDLVDVKLLNLSNNLITFLYYESFSPMTKLHNLDLSHNQLEYIPDKTFISNHNLRHVNMTNNSFRHLKNLQMGRFHMSGGVVDLSNNNLETIKIPFDDAKRLTVLILDSNNITEASDIDLYHQNDLQKLTVSRNRIGYLKNSLRLPVSLANLDFSRNQISFIGPSTFRYVSHLDTLQLSHNNLTNLSYGIFHGLKELKNLDLSYNNIRYLDSKVLIDLKQLRVLHLGFNKMNYLDDKGWLGHKFNLKVFVDGNHFTCEWLGTALTNFDNGYTKMRPTVLMESSVENSLEGIPCVPGTEVSQNLRAMNVEGDERLLLTTQKILEAIREQNYFLRKFLWQSMRNNIN